jgi:hypothetical protein
MADNCPTCGHMTTDGRQKMADQAKENPIYKTDFSKPLAELVEILRHEMTRTRGKLGDITSAYPVYHDDLDSVEGLLTCGISYLYHVKKKMEEHTIRYHHGEKFNPRGIGSDHTPGCFCCGGDPGLYSNISGFVVSKESGEKVVAMFQHGARLDYREHEPSWIQVKIGACKEHYANLQKLGELTAGENVITPKKVADAMGLPPSIQDPL